VGAAQQRFAWGLGLLLALPMFYMLVIHWQPNPIKVFICILCLLLLIMESAFSICLGCKIYNLIMSKKATHCPGGVCEIQTKDPIQTFNVTQKIIVALVTIAFSAGLYAYFTKVESKTMLAKKVSLMLMSAEEITAREETQAQKEFDEL